MANELRLHQNYLGGLLSQILPAAATVVADGATTNADATVTSATAAFTAADVGAPISGTNIPAGAYVASINSATSVEISANATGTGSGISITISREKVMHSAALAAMSTIGTTQHMMVGIDPDGDGGGAPEIVMVTKHDASATWAQIARGKEGTTARAHAVDEDWVHGGLAGDQVMRKWKTADEAVTSNATPQNDDELFLPVGANEEWLGEFKIVATGATTGDISIDMAVPASAAGWYAIVGPTRSMASVEGDVLNQVRPFGSGAGSAGLLGTGATDGMIILVHFYIAVSSTAGNIQLQWAQRVSDATATTVKVGSSVEARRVA